MTRDPPLERLQKIADFRTTRKHLRDSGRGGIVWGCLILVFGTATFDGQVADYSCIALGVVESLVGIRNLLYPSAFGIVLEAGLLITVGAWRLSVEIFALQNGGNIGWGWFVFNLMLVMAGFGLIRRYSYARDAYRDPPTIEQLAWFDDLMAEIHEEKWIETDDFVEFRMGLRWKAKRVADLVIVADENDYDNLIVDRHDIDIEDKGRVLFGSSRKVHLRIGRRTLVNAEFTPEMLARLQAWSTDEPGKVGDSSTIDSNAGSP